MQTAQNVDKEDKLQKMLKTMWAGMQICNMPSQGGRQVVKIAEQAHKQTCLRNMLRIRQAGKKLYNMRAS
jgi:hypothetical protein